MQILNRGICIPIKNNLLTQLVFKRVERKYEADSPVFFTSKLYLNKVIKCTAKEIFHLLDSYADIHKQIL